MPYLYRALFQLGNISQTTIFIPKIII